MAEPKKLEEKQVKIELKQTNQLMTELDAARERARVITLRRIRQQQEDEEMKALERKKG